MVAGFKYLEDYTWRGIGLFYTQYTLLDSDSLSTLIYVVFIFVIMVSLLELNILILGVVLC